MRSASPWILILLAASAHGQTRVEDFLSAYRSRALNLQTARSQLEQAEARAGIDSDLFQSNLLLIPAYSRNDYDYLGSGTRLRNQGSDLSAELTQATPLGLKLTLKGTKSYANARIGATYIDHQYSLGVALPLYQNAFGSGARLQERASFLAREAAEAELREQELATCSEGVDLYLQAWARQEEVAMLERSLQDAEQALKSAEKSYQRRLTRRIDWLSAQADHLALTNRLARARSDLALSLEQVRSYLPVPDRLADPTAYVLRPLDLNAELASNLLAARRASLDSAEANLDATRNLQRSSVELFAETGRANGETLSSPNEDFRESYVKAGLRISLPIVNRTRSATVSMAGAQQALAQARLREAERDLQAQSVSTAQEISNLSSMLRNQGSIIELHGSQLNEASRAMQAGRTEFEDYLRFRNAFLTEQLRGLELKSRNWKARSDWARLTGQGNYLCGAATQ